MYFKLQILKIFYFRVLQ